MTTKEIVVIEKKLTPVVEEVSSLCITDTTTMETASSLRTKIKALTKEVEDSKEELYRPAKDALDAINARYEKYEKPLKQALKIINDKMTAYQTMIFKKQKAEEAKIAARIAPGKGNLSLEKGMEKMANVEKAPVLETTGFYNKPVLEIYDAKLIPKEYMVPDEDRIEAALKTGQEIPGARMKDRLVPKSR